MKSCKSSETRFAKVWRRSEPCSTGKRPFEVSKKNERTNERTNGTNERTKKWKDQAVQAVQSRIAWCPEFRFFFKTSNGRLPPEHGSDRRQSLPKPVSDDPRHFIFRCRTKFFRRSFGPKNKFFGILARFLRSSEKTDVKIEFYAKRYAYRLILRSVRLKIAENKSVHPSLEIVYF